MNAVHSLVVSLQRWSQLDLSEYIFITIVQGPVVKVVAFYDRAGDIFRDKLTEKVIFELAKLCVRLEIYLQPFVWYWERSIVKLAELLQLAIVVVNVRIKVGH